MSSSFSSTPSVRCGARLSGVNGRATRTMPPIVVGLVVLVLVVGLGGDGSVDLPLPRAARLPPARRRWVAQLAISWVLRNPAVTVALVGIRRTEELKENVAAVEWPLFPDERQEVNTVFAEEGVRCVRVRSAGDKSPSATHTAPKSTNPSYPPADPSRAW